MNPNIDQLISEALALSPDERSALALTLLDSLDVGNEAEVSAAWAVEIQQRRSDLRTGATRSSPWAEVRARLSAL
jgi:putative addiction module component (TIGR02574 family)